MDWNWFFSSVAESMAAIVGIFAAFVITKIINNQNEFSKKQRIIDELIRDSDTLRDKAKMCHFKWYNERIRENRLAEINDEFIEKRVLLTPEEYYERYDFSEFEDKKQLLTDLKKVVKQYRDQLRKEEEETSEALKRLGPGKAIITQKPQHFQSIPKFVNELNQERDMIDVLIVDVKEQQRRIKDFVKDNESNPESSKLITACLAMALVLFYFGVIYPLSFLPMKTDSEIVLTLSAFWEILFSFRGLLLFVVSIIFSAIIVLFISINQSLKYEKGKLSDLKKGLKFGWYSVYLQNMEDNTPEKPIA